MLGLVSQDKLEQAAGDDSFLAALEAVWAKFTRYLGAERWYKGGAGDSIAYFSMEYGLDVALPVYSGGLGMLSGDHYENLVRPRAAPGRSRASLPGEGISSSTSTWTASSRSPIRRTTGTTCPSPCAETRRERRISVQVELGPSAATAWIWQVKVGKNLLYLLDTNIEANPQPLRLITASLYGGDRETRMQQEIVLGVGGIRALDALGIKAVCMHMNEGHSAFLGVERIRQLMRGGRSPSRRRGSPSGPPNVFTTHTPVPAGNERFSSDLMEKYFGEIARELGLSWKEFLGLGREDPNN